MFSVRKIKEGDRRMYLTMTKDFYSSDAVLLHVSDDHFEDTFEELMRSDTYAECHILMWGDAIAGYALLAKTYSQEAGGTVLWIEEIYVLPEYRGRGIGKSYFKYLFDNRPKEVRRFRLEAEAENESAIRLYRSLGFEPLEYGQLIIDFEK